MRIVRGERAVTRELDPRMRSHCRGARDNQRRDRTDDGPTVLEDNLTLRKHRLLRHQLSPVEHDAVFDEIRIGGDVQRDEARNIRKGGGPSETGEHGLNLLFAATCFKRDHKRVTSSLHKRGGAVVPGLDAAAFAPRKCSLRQTRGELIERFVRKRLRTGELHHLADHDAMLFFQLSTEVFLCVEKRFRREPRESRQ